ncbi:SCAR-like protein 2 [Panicum miliaceum]|uniref:SCAR-like protein 2 n=1 Tax=Panicum miliaceum TaxID=4540 RepID=A0A3L6QN37_PANMI|nr:SCAR-like protein 2 [Panicum miliaceum]
MANLPPTPRRRRVAIFTLSRLRTDDCRQIPNWCFRKAVAWLPFHAPTAEESTLVQTTWGIAVSSRGPALSRHGSLQFLCMMMSMKLHKDHLILLVLADSSVMLLHQMVLLLLIPSRPSRIQQQLAAETSCNKYKGSSMDVIASTVTSLPRNRATEALLPLLVADPVFSIQDSVPESEGAIHTKKLPGCRGSDVPLTMNQWMQKQMTNKMWLSVKVHTGPITYRKPSGKYPVQRAEGRILKITELSGLAAHSYEAWSEPAGTNQRSGAETHSQQQEARQQLARADSDMDMQVPDRPTQKQAEDHDVFYRKGAEVSSCRGKTVSDWDANKHSNADQA